ncbi:primosomal protein N' [Fundidesulfovibrio butyratiphilus]
MNAVKAVLLSPPFGVLTYSVPALFSGWDLPPGLRVAVPVGGSLRAAVLAGRDERPPEGVSLKDILWPLERSPLLSPDYVAMAENLAARQSIFLGQVLSSLVPAGLRTARAHLTWRSGGRRVKLGLGQLSGLEEGRLAELALAWRAGEVELAFAAMDRDLAYRLGVDPPWPVRPAAKAQTGVLECLFARGPMTAKALREALGPSAAQALVKLEAKGCVLLGPAPDDPEETPEIQPPGAPPPLTDEQRLALEEMSPLVGHGQTRLVHGVTGSGKTRLYFELAAKCLEQGRSALLLAPEVALAQALRSRARAWFGFDPVFSHGYQTPAKRERTFREMGRERGPRLIVGTRSALFLPVSNLGLIVLDEEHDASFKQDERMNYQAKEVAYFRAMREKALLVLGSATPDVKTYHAAREGLLPVSVLAKRAGPGRLPDIELVNVADKDKAVLLRFDGQRDRAGLLVERSLRELRETVDRGEQAIILLNRRGFAPVLYCLDCETIVGCPNCQVSLTYHKARERLVCHYCGLSQPFPRPCASCGSTSFLPMGEGTEMLADQLTAALPPEVALARLDRDAARRAERAEAILDDFAKGRTQVLVGTQMLSKGHDFPQVTLVIAADADLGLNLPDYRARERAFQMLVQVAGRAGRGERPGKVLIQTRTLQDPFWEYVRQADYRGFFEDELARRRKYGYPPFVKLGLVRASYPRDWECGPEVLSALAKDLRGVPGVRVLGPAPAPIPLVRNRLRFHCLLKAQDWPAIRQAYAKAVHGAKGPGKLRLALDLDPVDML